MIGRAIEQINVEHGGEADASIRGAQSTERGRDGKQNGFAGGVEFRSHHTRRRWTAVGFQWHNKEEQSDSEGHR